MDTPTRHPELTYNLHAGQVYPDLLEAGEAGRRVVLPTLAVLAPAPVVGAFGWVVQPAGQRESSGERGGRPGACRAGLPESSSPTCARTPRRSSPRPRAPGSGIPWGGRTASLHRRSERQTETPRGGSGTGRRGPAARSQCVRKRTAASPSGAFPGRSGNTRHLPWHRSDAAPPCSSGVTRLENMRHQMT